MAVRIRLKKLGRKHQPYFRICVMDSRTNRDGKTIEEVGTYDPMVRDTNKRVTMKAERIDYWLSVGALPTEKVKVLIDKFKGKVPETRIDQRRSRAIPDPKPAKPKPVKVEAPPVEAAAPAAELPVETPTAEPKPVEATAAE